MQVYGSYVNNIKEGEYLSYGMYLCIQYVGVLRGMIRCKGKLVRLGIWREAGRRAPLINKFFDPPQKAPCSNGRVVESTFW
jgi:hypothetical protein